MAGAEAARGIRIAELWLAGLAATSRSYGVSFRQPNSDLWRPLSVIAGPSQTGKTTVIDFVRYCLGDDEHPQHPEVLSSVRSALLDAVLAGESTTIERSATGPASKFASVWKASIGEVREVSEQRLLTEPPSNPEGLSQYLLAACGLDNVELPVAPTQSESSTNILSIRDLFRVMWLPNERVGSKNLLFEHSNYMIPQKLRQTIDVMFDVHDADGNDLAARLKSANDAARDAARTAASLRNVAQEEYPLGPLVLETDRDRAHDEAAAIAVQLDELDRNALSRESGIVGMREALAAAQVEARAAAVRVRNRASLLERLAALRGQYADDKKKLTFLKEAERLFDPLHVAVCPACLSSMTDSPAIIDGTCSLCGEELPHNDGVLTLGTAAKLEVNGVETSAGNSVESKGADSPPVAVLEAELRATNRRVAELNDYWTRLDEDLKVLRSAQSQADAAAEDAANALDRIAETPAPYLAVRDDLTRRRSEALLREQHAAAGLRLWGRVSKAQDIADRLAGQASRLRAERREAVVRPDRAAVVRLLSRRFGEILADIGYPKLTEPFLDDKLIPSVRGLPYTAASSGGLVLISLAWYLALWEVAYEQGARGPGLLIIDSPQKNLGHAVTVDDPDFADSRLVENFYRHAKDWLEGPGAGAQLIVIDNSPPDMVADDVVVRYTRDRSVFPYGLISDAID